MSAKLPVAKRRKSYPSMFNKEEKAAADKAAARAGVASFAEFLRMTVAHWIDAPPKEIRRSP